jgi:calcineurin-like phosphoesterase family protein
MKYFYSSDHHFDHRNIVRLCNRPFETLEDMQQTMIDNWNSVVGQNDRVYILGDFAFSQKTFEIIVPKLKGYKTFIKGNHDRKALKKCKFDVTQYVSILDDSIHNVMDNNRKVILCHYPLYEWEDSYKGSIHLFGHCHSNIGVNPRNNAYDVGVDCWNFTPKTLDEIVMYK